MPPGEETSTGEATGSAAPSRQRSAPPISAHPVPDPTSALRRRGPVVSTSAGDETEKPLVLVVDDTPVNRRLLRGILESEELSIVEAGDGAKAIELARRLEPSLLLLDIVMPDPDGHEVCRALKRDPRTRDIPVVFLSARDRAEDRARGLCLGVADYITKPFGPSEVVARVRTQIELRDARRTLSMRQRQVEAELAAAAEIKKTLLAVDAETPANFEILRHNQPSADLGGDMLGVQRLADGRFGMYIFRVAGHGVTSVLTTIAVRQYLDRVPGATLDDCSTQRRIEPAEVLTGLDLVHPIDRVSRHLTIAYLTIDCREGSVSYSCAAHPMPLVVRASGEIDQLSNGGAVIGMGGLLPFEQGGFLLEPGDRLMLFTHGLTEAENQHGEPFGEERVRRVLRRGISTSLDETRRLLVHELSEHLGNQRAADEVTFLLADWQGPPSVERGS